MAEETTTAILLVSCRDQKGLVAGISDFIYRNDGNIVHADQHTDHQQGIFLQRVEWQLEGFRISRERIAEAFRPVAERYEMKWDLRFSDYVPRVAILASTLDHCLQDLLWRQRSGEYRATVPLVISNHDTLRPLIEGLGVQFRHYPITPDTKAEQEGRMLQTLQEERIDLVVLARYMRVLGQEFVSQYPNRIINIHHSFLPAFVGARPYHQAYERGVKVIGATAHYVTADLDQGPIIEQDVVRISHRDSTDDLVRKGRDLEKVVLARAVHLHLRNRILVYGNKTVVFD
ncbi:MAG: formyltetrahydrofolate deformylase [Chloroflexi bacterium]|nr:formyltetrahydrofolate deformylase [Chloroflexota bacterium]